MFLGHYAVAMGAKRVAPRISLGTLVLAAQFADLLWPIFLLLGIERVKISPGLMARSSLDFVHYPITHSLFGITVLGIIPGSALLRLHQVEDRSVGRRHCRGEPLDP